MSKRTSSSDGGIKPSKPPKAPKLPKAINARKKKDDAGVVGIGEKAALLSTPAPNQDRSAAPTDSSDDERGLVAPLPLTTTAPDTSNTSTVCMCQWRFYHGFFFDPKFSRYGMYI